MRGYCWIVLLFCFFIFSSCGTEKKKTLPSAFKFKVVEDVTAGREVLAAAYWGGQQKLLAVAFVGGRIAIYSLPGLSIEKKIETKLKAVRSIALVRNGSSVAVVTMRGELRFYDIKNGEPIVFPELAKLRKVVCVASNSVKNLLAVGLADGRLLFITTDMRSIAYRKTPYKIVRRIAFNEKGTLLACAGGRRSFSLYRTTLFQRGRGFYTSSPVVSFAFTKKSAYLAVGTLFWKMRIYDIKKNRLLNDAQLKLNPVSAVAFHPVRKWLFAGSGKVGKGMVEQFVYPVLKKKNPLVFKAGEPLLLRFIGKEQLVMVTSLGDIFVYE